MQRITHLNVDRMKWKASRFLLIKRTTCWYANRPVLLTNNVYHEAAQNCKIATGNRQDRSRVHLENYLQSHFSHVHMHGKAILSSPCAQGDYSNIYELWNTSREFHLTSIRTMI